VLGRTNSFGNSYDYYYTIFDTIGNLISEQAIGSPDFDWLQDAIFLPKDSSFVLFGYRQESQGYKKYRQLTKISRAGLILWQKEEEVHADTQFKNMHLINDSVFGFVGNEFNTTKSRFGGLFKAYNYLGALTDSIQFNNTPSRNFCFNDFAYASGNKIKIVGSMFYSNQAGDFSDMRMWTYRLTVDTLIWAGNGIGDNYNTSYSYLVFKKNAPNECFFIESAYKSNFQTYSDGLLDESISDINYDNAAYFMSGVTNVSAPGNDVYNQAIQTLDGGMIIVGYNEYFGNAAQNATLLKVGPNGEAVAPYSPPSEENFVLETTSLKTNLTFDIFPNPAKNKLTIKAFGVESVDIFDIYGKIVYHTTNTNTDLDISQLTPGIYVIQVQTESGFGIKRLVKE
jgi:hypothetical protein